MAEIFVRYIMIKKDVNKEEFQLIDKVKQFFKENYDIDQLEGIINIEKGELSYYIKPNSDATRCFVSFVAKGHIRIISKAIEDVNYKLKSSKFRKYFYILKAYDGLSKYYCEKLYPKYSEYERKLRCMVLLIVTKAYGKGWVANTVKGELQKNVTTKARGNINRIPMEDILEYFDLSDLENYLFAPQEIDIAEFVEKELSPEKLALLDKAQICLLIKKARRPSCLWERIFTGVGNVEEWKEITKSVHDVRNCVAHNKKLSKEECDETLKTLKKINSKLDAEIDAIIVQEIEDEKKIDILGNFAFTTQKLKIEQSEHIGMDILLKEFSRKVKELATPIEKKWQSEISEVLKKSMNSEVKRLYEDEYHKNISQVVNAITLNDNWKNISDEIKKLKKDMAIEQEQINAIRLATKFEKVEG